jgi:hypothetical protein
MDGQPKLDGTPFATRGGGMGWVVRVGMSNDEVYSPDSRILVNDPAVHRA